MCQEKRPGGALWLWQREALENWGRTETGREHGHAAQGGEERALPNRAKALPPSLASCPFPSHHRSCHSLWIQLEEHKTNNLHSHPASTASSNSPNSWEKQVAMPFGFQTQNYRDGSYLILGAGTLEANMPIPQIWSPFSSSHICHSVTTEGLGASDRGQWDASKVSFTPKAWRAMLCLSVPPQGPHPARPPWVTRKSRGWTQEATQNGQGFTKKLLSAEPGCLLNLDASSDASP